MLLPISRLPEKESQLRTPSTEVDLQELNNPAFQTFLDDMIETMYDDDGIGLAAPQVNKNIRVFTVGKDAVMNYECLEGDLPKRQDAAIINPVWQKTSRKTKWEVEGCLSVPRYIGKVKRYTSIEVTAYDRFGKKLHFIAKGYLARVIQHECDHLDGVLFIDKAKQIEEHQKPI